MGGLDIGLVMGFIDPSVHLHWHSKVQNVISKVQNGMKFGDLEAHSLGALSYFFNQIHDVSVLITGCPDVFLVNDVFFHPLLPLKEGLNHHYPISKECWPKFFATLSHQIIANLGPKDHQHDQKDPGVLLCHQFALTDAI